MIDPPKLDWKGISLQALKAPLQQWRLFLACAALPALIYLVLRVIAEMVLPELSKFGVPEQASALLFDLLLLLPTFMFAWRWMSALWHGDTPSVGQLIGLRLFWSYAAIFAFLELLFSLGGYLAQLGHDDLVDVLSGSGPAESRGANSGLLAFSFVLPVFLTAIFRVWIETRLAPWGAAIIDRHILIGPRPIWQMTRGHAWRIFVILAIVAIPTLAISWLLVYITTFLLPPSPLFVLQAVLAPFTVYGLAVEMAATLLIYRHLNGQRVDPTIDVF
jgi:hypothetical protein